MSKRNINTVASPIMARKTATAGGMKYHGRNKTELIGGRKVLKISPDRVQLLEAPKAAPTILGPG